MYLDVHRGGFSLRVPKELPLEKQVACDGTVIWVNAG